MHPLAVILAIATGALLAGIVGALFAVPLVAVGNKVVGSLAGRERPPVDGEPVDDEPVDDDGAVPA